MKLHQVLIGAVLSAALAGAGAASASTVSVSAFAGPWDPSIAGNPAYGTGDNASPTTVAVNAGDNITITYLSGLTSAFTGADPSVDALGYVGGAFGSGVGLTGIGSSGSFFPSHAIDPTNTASDIWLAALIGDFVNSSGQVLSVFAPGDGPLNVMAPMGSTALQLGLNDDIFSDNAGSLNISVTGSTASAAPEPATWAAMLFGLFGIGAALRMRRKLVTA
jgi:hypothetical protein